MHDALCASVCKGRKDAKKRHDIGIYVVLLKHKGFTNYNIQTLIIASSNNAYI